MSKIVLSIVIPCHNEEENVGLIYASFLKLSSQLPFFELVFVDDASTDRTAEVIRALSKEKPPFAIRLISLSRNFGHQLALLAGMQASRGAACVSIDADLQDPPETIPEMVKSWRAGNEVVLGQRINRSSDTFFKRFSAKMFYRVMSSLTRGKFPENVGDFRLVDRKVLNILANLKETGPYWRGLSIWVGYKSAIVPYVRHPRLHGETKYPFWKMVSFAFDAIFSFSKAPLQLASLVGFAISILSVLFGLSYVVLKIMGFDLVRGWTSLLFVISFLGGFQLVCLGILGQYVGRIYEQTLARPTVISREPETIVEGT